MDNRLRADDWAGAPSRGALPKVPTRDTLPTASEAYAYRMVVIRGAPDVMYVCLRDNLGAWAWEVAATG